IGLAPDSDSLPLDDDQTTFEIVTLIGQTEPNTVVTLATTGATTKSDAKGAFQFTGIPLESGANSFIVQAVDAAGNAGSGSRTITRTAGDIVLQESNLFTVGYSKTFTVFDSSSVLTFSFAQLAFDTTSVNYIKDAFEAAFVDASGQTLVHTIASGRDAFFN